MYGSHKYIKMEILTMCEKVKKQNVLSLIEKKSL